MASRVHGPQAARLSAGEVSSCSNTAATSAAAAISRESADHCMPTASAVPRTCQGSRVEMAAAASFAPRPPQYSSASMMVSMRTVTAGSAGSCEAQRRLRS